MKTPRLKDWVEGSVQVGMFVRTKIGETAEYRSRLVTASNQARIAKILAQLLMESRELAAEVHKALGAMLLEGGPGLLTGAKSAAPIVVHSKLLPDDRKGWIVGVATGGTGRSSPQYVSYIECWTALDGSRFADFNYFDNQGCKEGDTRLFDGAGSAIAAALHWLKTGEMLTGEMLGAADAESSEA